MGAGTVLGYFFLPVSWDTQLASCLPPGFWGWISENFIKLYRWKFIPEKEGFNTSIGGPHTVINFILLSATCLWRILCSIISGILAIVPSSQRSTTSTGGAPNNKRGTFAATPLSGRPRNLFGVLFWKSSKASIWSVSRISASSPYVSTGRTYVRYTLFKNSDDTTSLISGS